MSNKCIVCDIATLKYKCPKCLARYCSVSCCKTHKAKCSEQPDPSNASTNASTINSTVNVPNYPLWKVEPRSNKYPIDEEEDDSVPEERLEMLHGNDHIKKLLKNPHLRAMCENLVNTDNPSLEMAKAMQEPIFTELADECLKVVDTNNPHLEPQQDTSSDEED